MSGSDGVVASGGRAGAGVHDQVAVIDVGADRRGVGGGLLAEGLAGKRAREIEREAEVGGVEQREALGAAEGLVLEEPTGGAGGGFAGEPRADGADDAAERGVGAVVVGAVVGLDFVARFSGHELEQAEAHDEADRAGCLDEGFQDRDGGVVGDDAVLRKTELEGAVGVDGAGRGERRLGRGAVVAQAEEVRVAMRVVAEFKERLLRADLEAADVDAGRLAAGGIEVDHDGAAVGAGAADRIDGAEEIDGRVVEGGAAGGRDGAGLAGGGDLGAHQGDLVIAVVIPAGFGEIIFSAEGRGLAKLLDQGVVGVGGDDAGGDEVDDAVVGVVGGVDVGAGAAPEVDAWTVEIAHGWEAPTEGDEEGWAKRKMKL